MAEEDRTECERVVGENLFVSGMYVTLFHGVLALVGNLKYWPVRPGSIEVSYRTKTERASFPIGETGVEEDGAVQCSFDHKDGSFTIKVFGMVHLPLTVSYDYIGSE